MSDVFLSEFENGFGFLRNCFKPFFFLLNAFVFFSGSKSPVNNDKEHACKKQAILVSD